MNTTNLKWRNEMTDADKTQKLREAIMKTAAMWAERWRGNDRTRIL